MGDEKNNFIIIEGAEIDIDHVRASDLIKGMRVEIKKALIRSLDVSPDKKPFVDTSMTWGSSTVDSRPYQRGGVINPAKPYLISDGSPQAMIIPDPEFYIFMTQQERQLSRDMSEALGEIGLHEEMVEKLRFVLKKKAGVEALFKLTPKQIVDTETVVQTLLKVYDEVSGE